MRPVKIPQDIKHIMSFLGYSREAISVRIYQKCVFQRFFPPEVSVILPAYNEDQTILYTILSLAESATKRRFEIIVINNNSTDNTEAVVKATGVRYINETVQGITAARNAGLGTALGKYVLSADADTIYPANWIDEMVAPLEQDGICLTYGGFAFLPSTKTPRFVYFLYENMADLSRLISKKFRDEAINVYGFNLGFRRDQALAVDWFNHPRGANEDGWLAMKLRDKGFGSLYQVSKARTLVWSSDRRIIKDGGLLRAFGIRLKRSIGLSR